MTNCMLIIPLLMPVAALSQTQPVDSVGEPTELQEFVVTSKNTVRKLSGATNTTVISSAELRRAACCNLGESFSTNPSVDVSYSDAATGARQIKLLGLSGSYVQMLTENVPAGRGVAAPYALGYIAGPWMQSIQVSKGASSVKNGFESITGQINVELRKPQNDPQVNVNLYYDSMNKLEVNFDGNMHIGNNWSTGLMVHGENAFSAHDSNGDSFADLPQTRQIAVLNRWARMGANYVFQAAAKFLGEWRRGGQRGHHAADVQNPYLIDIDTRRVEFFTKNAYIYNHDCDGNVALILSGSYHDQDARYGNRMLDITQGEGYASLMHECRIGTNHHISAGFSASVDRFDHHYILQPSSPLSKELLTEASAGIYGQYTFTIGETLTAMAGLRLDRHNHYGWLLTPRMHARWKPAAWLSLNASAGRGFRAPHPLAEFSYLLASSRTIDIADQLDIESAWNTGVGATATFSPGGHDISLSAEYYFTDFSRRLVVDLDSDPRRAFIHTSRRPSRSHAVQVELTASPHRDLTLTAAWRCTDVKADLGHGLVEMPLTSRHKGLVTVGYSPMLGLWQADVTFAVNGGGRFPAPARTDAGTDAWPQRYKAWPSLNAQLTRNFRHWSVYIGGENLTGFRQSCPVRGASDPWGPDFDASMVYGPLHGAMAYIGFRYNFTKY